MKIHLSDAAEADIAAFIVDEKGRLPSEAEALDKASGGLLSAALEGGRFAGELGQRVDVVLPAGGPARRASLLGGGKARARDGGVFERLGAETVRAWRLSGFKSLALHIGDVEGAARAAVGAELAGYRFDDFFTKIKPKQKPSLTKATIVTADVKAAKAAFKPLEAGAAGTAFARDLVNSPPNVLFPESFAKRLDEELAPLGVEVEILGEADMRSLGMGSLLGVGQGSVRESKLGVMIWRGAPDRKDPPVALVGKGVCFDTGGISLKPGPNMEDMRGDMGGAAAVAGAMKALAIRKAKANVVGLVGLVENMPDGGAIRPGDILTSASGQTIEVQNTDAEGRLVLADVLWYAQERFKAKTIVDLATLTGAIVISLGHEYAGVFTNSNKLAESLSAAGEAEGELNWRMPMGPVYDRMLKSKFADMRNIGGRAAGSITAAQFLKRFIEDDVDWAHMDIAGVAWREGEKPANDPSWASGYGPRLLNRWILDNFED